ncbi:hypothetical protein MPLB_960014 [Mesorhizobium sp. ORS 3324]|nr:hypothetical protein MPLB_960014 [Mesorhizobium sp. ORS 3324]
MSEGVGGGVAVAERIAGEATPQGVASTDNPLKRWRASAPSVPSAFPGLSSGNRIAAT